MKRGARAAWIVLWLSTSGFEPFRIVEGHVAQGNVHMGAGRPEEALRAYDEAAQQRPGEPGVHFNRGTALSALKRWDDAAKAYLQAAALAKPTNVKAQAFYNLGNAYAQSDKFADAIEAYKRALTLNPTDANAKWNLELALRKKQDEDKKKQDEDKKKQDEGKKKPDDNKDKKDSPGDDQKKPDDQKKSDDQKKPDDQKKSDDQKSDEPKGSEGSPPPSPAQDPPAKPETPAPGKETPPASAQELREIDGILDSLERSPRALEQERARLRAVRRRPPVRDW